MTRPGAAFRPATTPYGHNPKGLATPILSRARDRFRAAFVGVRAGAVAYGRIPLGMSGNDSKCLRGCCVDPMGVWGIGMVPSHWDASIPYTSGFPFQKRVVNNIYMTLLKKSRGIKHG